MSEASSQAARTQDVAVTALSGGKRRDGDGGRSGGATENGGTVAPRTRATAGWGSAAGGGYGAAAGRAAPDSTADPWPDWARAQLRAAVSLARRTTIRPPSAEKPTSLASALYRGWYAPIVGRRVELNPSWPPLAGLYRSAHIANAQPAEMTRFEALGNDVQVVHGEVAILDRNDAIGLDGWWRTWGRSWSPRRPPARLVRVHLSARPDALPAVVREVTGALRDAQAAWLLACTTDVDRLRRAGSAVLYLPASDVASIDLAKLARRLRPSLRHVAPPLCLPVAPGVALAEDPGIRMSFGEHRCHLIALALRMPGARRAPLHEIAEVFRTHGIDPAAPHRRAT